MAVKQGSHGPRRERPGQRRRTRKAIVDATIALLAQGVTPSVNDVAAAADVSRRTIYLYFPTFDQLLIDATLGALSQAQVDRAIETGPGGDEKVDDRVERLVRALHHVTPEAERLGRALIRLTVDAPAPPLEGATRRGYRRVEWIEQALAPVKDRIAPAEWRRLVCGLAMIVGWEALIVQRDVCGLAPDEGEALSVWAARALLHAAMKASPDSDPVTSSTSPAAGARGRSRPPASRRPGPRSSGRSSGTRRDTP